VKNQCDHGGLKLAKLENQLFFSNWAGKAGKQYCFQIGRLKKLESNSKQT